MDTIKQSEGFCECKKADQVSHEVAELIRTGKLVVPMTVEEMMEVSARAYFSGKNKNKFLVADLLVDVCEAIHQAMLDKGGKK